MDPSTFEQELEERFGEGLLPDCLFIGSAGGAACGDVITVRADLLPSGDVAIGWDADGCGALAACASAAARTVTGQDLLTAATVSTSSIGASVGGLSAAKIHAAELVCDAVHRALGELVMGCELGSLKGDVGELTLVAMSGGVDSAVAAHLCEKRGPVAGVTVELWRDEATDARGSCCSHVAVRRARSLAHARGLPHFTLDLRDEFRDGVVDPWVESYAAGSTPNPCVTCNGRVRLGPMADLARRIGAAKLATGHYARISELSDPRGPVLQHGVDPSKDQAYALMRVPAEILAMLAFPLGEMTKVQVRQLAEDVGIPVAHQPDSQDLCFLAGIGRDGFLARHGSLGPVAGPIVNEKGERIGVHEGHHRHTVGQRRGLNLGGGTPLYVLETNASENSVTVGPREALQTDRVRLVDVDLRRDVGRVGSVQLRHRAPVASAIVSMTGPDEAVVQLSEPLERVAPGQVACLMDGDIVLGCGTVAVKDA